MKLDTDYVIRRSTKRMNSTTPIDFVIMPHIDTDTAFEPVFFAETFSDIRAIPVDSSN